jgi:uncharacterized membrane protein YoaK (UPF0700 family)
MVIAGPLDGRAIALVQDLGSKKRGDSKEHNGVVPGASDHPSGFLHQLLDDPRHGPLPALLIVMTATTGIVDAVSILSLGRVFVANMTGNVVFVGFALAGAKGFSLAASLFALGGFLLGAVGGGSALRHLQQDRAELMRNAVATELGLLTLGLVLALLAGVPVPATYADVIALTLATALGLQNVFVRRLSVPDLTTTVLTMTLTGIAADTLNGDPAVAARRILAVVAMLAGAGSGALLVLRVNPSASLALAVFLMGCVLIAAPVAAKGPAEWQK